MRYGIIDYESIRKNNEFTDIQLFTTNDVEYYRF